MLSVLNEMAPVVEGEAGANTEESERTLMEQHTGNKGVIAHHWKLKQTTTVEADYVQSKEKTTDKEKEDKKKTKSSRTWCSCFGRAKVKE